MNYNRNYFSRRGREFIPKPIDPGFTIDPAKVEAYKEYCLNNGLIKFPPPVSPTIDGTMEVYDIQQSYDIPGSGKNHNLLDGIVYHYTGKNLIDFDYVLCTISNLSYSGVADSFYYYLSNADTNSVRASDRGAGQSSGFLIYQSETGKTVFNIPNFPVSFKTTISGSNYSYSYALTSSPQSVVIETLIVGKLPENQ
uniref:Putative ORF2 n=1 Tax=Po-Circo-like virus 41 TaxID=1105385 RepID=A0A8G1GLF2_9VIRU|nr:putative ORF2 [Po-Circo-like virus 41]QZA75069.1 putative ORF2 [Po-Circo-like virus 41]